jgi:hypothetical protein
MSLARTVGFCAYLAIVTVGCQSAPPWATTTTPSVALNPLGTQSVVPQASVATAQSTGVAAVAQRTPANIQPAEFVGTGRAEVATASFGEPAVTEIEELKSLPTVESETELSLQEFLAEVQARNPTLEAMAMAWRAAAKKYPQAVAPDDSMFLATTAPDSLGHSSSESAYAFQLDQNMHWFGKRAAKG